MAYTIDITQSIWRVTFSEALTNTDLLRLLNDAQVIERSAPVIANRLVDFRPLRSIEIDFGDLSDFAAERRKLILSNTLKTAIVTGNPVQFGFARMFQTIIEHPRIQVELFKDEKDALEWLLE